MNRSGFSIVDLLAAIALLAVTLLFTLAATTNLDNARNRVKCASNLRQIGQAILLYSNDNRGPYPRTRYDINTADHPTAYTGANSKDPFVGTGGPKANDVSAAMYLLLRTEDITSAVFICPATGDKPYDYGGGIANALDKSNFPDGKSLDYSYANPYPNAAAARQGYKLVQGVDPNFVVVADMNPGVPAVTQLTPSSSAQEMRTGNSTNHSGDGQNVLYGDGHVEFQNNPFCGVNRDNIYTYGSGGAGIFGSPVGPADTVLLPAAIMPASDAIAATAPPESNGASPAPIAAAPPMDQSTDLTMYLAIASLIFLAVLVAGIILVVVKRRRETSGPPSP